MRGITTMQRSIRLLSSLAAIGLFAVGCAAPAQPAAPTSAPAAGTTAAAAATSVPQAQAKPTTAPAAPTTAPAAASKTTGRLSVYSALNESTNNAFVDAF